MYFEMRKIKFNGKEMDIVTRQCRKVCLKRVIFISAVKYSGESSNCQ